MIIIIIIVIIITYLKKLTVGGLAYACWPHNQLTATTHDDNCGSSITVKAWW